MKIIKVSEATGPALDWLVAKCEGKNPSMFIYRQTGQLAKEHHYSADWSQGGPIIERENLCTSTDVFGTWMAWVYDGLEMLFLEHGPTPLIAAMRCYCCASLGEFVNVPEGLCQQQNS